MHSSLRPVGRLKFFRVALCICLPLIALTFATASEKRIRITPMFSAGQTLRYSVESRTTSTGKTTTPIVNPEGGSQSTQLIHLIVRLDVLAVQPATPASPGSFHLRATYEKSSAESETDAYDPAAPSLADQYARIEGRSIEFTIDPAGKLSGIKGLEDIFPDRSTAPPVLSWIDALFSGGGFPSNGVTIGQKWKTDRPVTGAPLRDLTSTAESTYLRDEPCNSSGRAAASANETTPNPGACAMILTRFEISRRSSLHSDATPEDYIRNGLRTSGTWTGSGESLDSISLSSSLLVSSTQTSKQNMDYQITSATTGSSIHRVAQVQSQSEITLLPNQP
jgi:hypothetical protein